MSRQRRRLIQLVIAALTAVIWESIGRSSNRMFFLVGAPTAIAHEFVSLIVQSDLHRHFVVTGFEAIAGIIVGTAVGTTAGLALWFSRKTADVVRPFVIAAGTMPVFTLAPLMIVWFGIGVAMKIAMATLATIFVAFNQAQRGATSVATEYLDTMQGMDAKPMQVFTKVIVPGSVAWVFSSMRLNVGFGLLGAFIGEFVASDRGLGFIILRASSLYNIPRALAASCGIIILALLLDRAADMIERRRNELVQVISVPRILRRHGKRRWAIPMRLLQPRKRESAKTR